MINKKAGKKPRIAIISSAENDENILTNNAFITDLNAGLQDSAQVEWYNYNNIGLRMKRGDIEAFVVSTGDLLHDFELVYFKSYFRYNEQATAIAESLDHHNVRFVGSELRHYIPAYKLTQMARLARAGFDIPETLYLPMKHLVSHYDEIVKCYGKKFIFKAIDGSTGDDNYLVKKKEDFEKLVRLHSQRHFVVQKFIKNESDLRILIVGNKVRMVIERRRSDDTTHLNNTSQGAEAHMIPVDSLSSDLEELSLKAATVMNRDIAGVDVMMEKDTDVPYILEVNASPQIASGAFVREKREVYVNYFRELLGMK